MDPELLKMSLAEMANIKRCHRMGRSSGGTKARPIVIKFDATAVRDKIWFAKTNLKGSAVTVSEFLTRQRHVTFMAAREKFGVTRCWTQEGFIYILGSNDVRHRIVTLGELHKIPLETNKPLEPTKIGVKSKRAVKK